MKSLIFDLDGTLADLESLHYQAHGHLLAHHGVALSPALYKARVAGRSNDEMLSHFFPSWTPAEKKRYGAHKEAHYRSLIGDIAPTPGTERLLQWASDHALGLALVTNAPRPNADLLLAKLRLAHCFSIVVLGEELPRTKPDPLPYRVALQHLGCEPDEALVFEDSGPGVQAGKAAGVFTVGITTTLSADELVQHGADLVITDFEDPGLWHHLRARVPDVGPNE